MSEAKQTAASTLASVQNLEQQQAASAASGGVSGQES